jgi:hypothetical protein
MLLAERPFLLGSIMATQEQLDLRKKWVDALRSGDYKQGKHYLRSGDDSFCCLGVLCDIMGLPTSKQDGQGPYAYESKGGNYTAYLSPTIIEQVGLNNVTGRINTGASLANMNDAGSSFEDIAAVIEAAPEGLFKD